MSEAQVHSDDARMLDTDVQVEYGKCDVAVQTEETAEQVSQLRSELNRMHMPPFAA